MPAPTPPTNPAAVSATIRRLRRERGLTQEALAQAVGVSPQAISKWETGQTMPDITLLLPISKVLGIGVNELLGGNRRQELEKKYQQACSLGEEYSLIVSLEALEEFPDDEDFLYRRACDELFIGKSGSGGAHLYIDRALGGFSKLCRKYPNDHVYRSMLVEAYLARGAVGDRDQAYAVALAYNGPGRNKEFLMEVFLDEEACITKKQKAIKKALHLLFMRLSDYGTPEATKAAHTLMDSLLGDEQNLHGLALRELFVIEAKLCLDAGDEEGFVHHLTKAYEYARTIDTLPLEEIPFQSPLFDRLCFDHSVRCGEENETYKFVKFNFDLLAHPAAEDLRRRIVKEQFGCRLLHKHNWREYFRFCCKHINEEGFFDFSVQWDSDVDLKEMHKSLRFPDYAKVEIMDRFRTLVEKLVSEGTMTGLVACFGETIFGFCNCGDKDKYVGLGLEKEERAIPTAPEGAKILAIVEILVSRFFQNCGIEEMLLDHALAFAKKQGFTHAEVYPLERMELDKEWFGRMLSLYEKMGFRVVRDLSSELDGRYFIMQKEL